VKGAIVNDNEAQEPAGKLVKKGSPQAVLKLAGTLSPEEADAILQAAHEGRQIESAITESAEKPKHSLMDLHGLGAEIWQGVDAQAYVNRLREEWDN
jgi:hypothetical protein